MNHSSYDILTAWLRLLEILLGGILQIFPMNLDVLNVNEHERTNDAIVSVLTLLEHKI